jgi:hypothetical protein
MRAERAVDPTRSENITVTWRRSARSSGCALGALDVVATSHRMQCRDDGQHHHGKCRARRNAEHREQHDEGWPGIREKNWTGVNCRFYPSTDPPTLTPPFA